MKSNSLNVPFHQATLQWFMKIYGKASPPQLQGWPAIASAQHTLILAPTGSGKTLAAFLWCIDDLFKLGLQTDAKIFEKNPRGVHTLYISPLKALNNDIHYNLQIPLQGISETAADMGISPPAIRSLVRTGDTPATVRQTMVKRPPHILITTPESLYLLITSRKGRLIFSHLRYIIVDEIHALCNNKRGVHLSLSLERLMPLCEQEPVRIGLSATQRPLKKIAGFLGGNATQPRPVTIVDCGQRKAMDLQIISPVESFQDLPDSSVWPDVIDTLYKLITSHRSTLVFVNMRAQSEKIARQLNERHRHITGDPEIELAWPHHSSISREVRYDIERRLKQGELPAVIATASLELGIDIGSIDLVVQMESPKSVSAGMQRVGRSGHLLSATSKGRIIPLYQADLDDSIALAQAMLKGDIEETHIPENCLDVLAQQIIAEVAMQEWNRVDLYHLIRRSYCYKSLTEPVFNTVVDMLSGRYGNNAMRALVPRISWDKVNDRLIPRSGAQLLAVMNGGTIPDRAYYGVYLEGENVRLGEVEEEFVFESRVGDVFFLGNTEWRINRITPDRLWVMPLRSDRPRAPFWKNEPSFRDFYTVSQIAAFRRNYLQQEAQGKADQFIAENNLADSSIVANLKIFFKNQKAHSGFIATDREILIERFRDIAGDYQVILHAPWGGRVNGALAIALATSLEKSMNVQIQYCYNDDGILVKFLDTLTIPSLEFIFKLSFTAIQDLVIETLGSTSLFYSRFRQNATRALLLQRSRLDKRIPLWLQRLHAADLLQVVKDFKDFPIIMETYRDCLQDLFDLDALKLVVEKIQKGEITIHTVDTPYPSPMASGLIFRFMAENMYQYDPVRVPARAVDVSSDLLAEIMASGHIPALMSTQQVEDSVKRWQCLTPQTLARDQEDLYEIIARLGPITRQELQDRAMSDITAWLQSLCASNRIVEYSGDCGLGFITAEDSAFFSSGLPDNVIPVLLRRLFASHGPLTMDEIKSRLAFDENELKTVIGVLNANKEIVRGQLVAGIDQMQYCDSHNFAQLYRHAVALRRESKVAADRDAFYRFLLQWHHVGDSGLYMSEVLNKYNGYAFAPLMLESSLFPNRGNDPAGMEARLCDSVLSGETIVRAAQASQSGTVVLSYFQRGQGNIFIDKSCLQFPAEANPAAIYQFLKENGASVFQDIVDGTGFKPAQMDDGLSVLCRKGLISCNDYHAFLRMIRDQNGGAETKGRSSWREDDNILMQTVRSRQGGRRMAAEKLARHRGYWFLIDSFAVMGKQLSEAQRAEKQARVLLQRYGILVKEWYRHEQGLLPWYQLFQVLKKLEWQGEIQRGYFVRGLSGLQFATTEALELLQKMHNPEEYKNRNPVMISTTDPALPFGGQVSWDVNDSAGNKLAVTRSPANHLLFFRGRPVMYSENYASRLWRCSELFAECMGYVPELIKGWLRLPSSVRPRRKIVITSIDGSSAAGSTIAAELLKNGFEKDGDRLVLWPSGV